MTRSFVRPALGVLGVLGLAASILVHANSAEAATPFASPDHYFVATGTSFEPESPGVFVNDIGVDPMTMTIRLLSNPYHGVASVTSSGVFHYDPEDPYIGPETFSYCIVEIAAPLACISRGVSIWIDVTDVRAVDDGYSTPAETSLSPVSPGVLGNDSGTLPGMSAAFEPAAHGTITPESAGGFTYRPSPGFRGIDTMNYCVTASLGSTSCLSNSATVSIRVGLDGLDVVDDHYAVDLDSSLVRPGSDGLFVNDHGTLPLDAIDIVNEPTHGHLSAVGVGGGFAYTPVADYAGTDVFTYCITAVPLRQPCLSTVATVTVDVNPVALRVGGPDRFAVSAAVSGRTFAAGVPVAYLASGTAFPDALSGSAAAGGHGPVLLVTHDSVPDAILAELRRLKPAKIVILGGTASIGAGVEDVVRPLTASVVRYGGADRYVVSAEVSRETFATGAPIAYVASGENFPDALSGSAAAGHLGGPVLLVTHDSVPADVATELARLKPARIVVLGGPNAIAASVLATLGGVAPTTRIGGADRFEVSAAVSESVFPTGARTVYVASGTAFPDALSGSSAAVSQNAPVLLVTSTTIPAAVATELDRLDPVRIIVLGGTTAVSDPVLTSLKSYLAG